MFNTDHHYNYDNSDNSVKIQTPVGGNFVKIDKKSFLCTCKAKSEMYNALMGTKPFFREKFKDFSVEIIQIILINDGWIIFELLKIENNCFLHFFQNLMLQM